MPDRVDKRKIDSVLRMLTTASRSLRLYPAASPIPRQSVDAVIAALQDVFAGGAESLPLAVAREGFESEGQPVAVGIPGGEELAADFRMHGVAEIHFAPSVSADDALQMLLSLAKPAEDTRAAGGFSAVLAAEGVQGIGVTEIVLTVIDDQTPDALTAEGELGAGAGAGSAEELADDPNKLGQWLSQAATGDRSGLQAGLVSLVTAVGPQGTEGLAASFAKAFAGQTTDTRDTLLGLAMEPGPFRNLMAEMFRQQSAGEIASSMLAGAFGRNMLSLSTALAQLPLDRLDAAVQAQVHAMLPGCGHTDAEARFLDHMIEVRKRAEPEPSLAASNQTYLAVAQAAAIHPDDLSKARRAVEASGAAVDGAGVRTMLTLLDQQTDPALAEQSATSIASLAGHLLGGQQLLLADYAIAELLSRNDRIPAERLVREAVPAESLGTLIDCVLADPSLLEPATRILRALDESAYAPFVAQAITRKAEGLALAEKLIGKRMMEHLNAAALHTEWFQLSPIVQRLALEGDSRCVATIEALMRRPDPQARGEIVSGLTAAGGPVSQRLLGELVRDQHAEVAVAAARALAKSGQAGSGEPIAARIAQLDLDNSDFELGRELIVALARTPDRIADDVLGRLASRRALIKRGRFNEVQQVVATALQARSREAVGR